MEQMQEALRKFIVDNFLFGQPMEGFDEQTSFLESRIIDSTGVLELVAFVEQTFGIEVLDEELDPDNLDSISKLVAFVTRKRGTS